MKIIRIIAIAIILMVCFPMACFAAESSHLHQPNLTASHPVYVYVIYNIEGKPDYYQSDDYSEEGQYYSVTTPEGLTFKVYYPKGGMTLVVHEIKEEAPLKWFNSLFTDHSSITPYEIFFLTERGGRLNLPDGIKIEIEGVLAKETMTLLTTKEEKTPLAYRVIDGKLTFYSAAEADYYVLGIKKPTPLRPQTGDTTNIALWIGLMALSVMGIMSIAALLLRPAKDEEADEEMEEAPKEISEEKNETKTPAPSVAKQEGARRRAQKSLGEIPEELNYYLDEIEDTGQ